GGTVRGVMTSYVTEYATSARSSRVGAQARAYDELAPVTALTDDEEHPRFVHLDPSGTRPAVRYATYLQLFDGNVAPLRRLTDVAWRGIAVITEWGAILGNVDVRWDGLTYDGHPDYTERSLRFPVKLANSGYELAARLSSTRWTSVA